MIENNLHQKTVQKKVQFGGRFKVQTKGEGKSLRQIAIALGISHEAVRKRLKAVNNKDQVSTNPEYQKLTASTIKKENVSTGSKPRKSRASEELKATVNQVSIQKNPSDTFTEGVNTLETPSDMPPDCIKWAFQRVDSEPVDLFEGIKVFLENHGVELYRQQCEPEGYQVKHNGQTIRIYVQRKMECPKSLRDGQEVGEIKEVMG